MFKYMFLKIESLKVLVMMFLTGAPIGFYLYAIFIVKFKPAFMQLMEIFKWMF